MKHIIYTSLILLLASACSKPAPSPETEKEQYGRYIFFSQQVETKASLIESAAAMDQFGVVGFKYEGEWASIQKTSLTPNVFYDDNDNIVNTETLTCNNDGTADYAPLQGWSSFKNYAFFAYYPISHKSRRDQTDHEAMALVNLDETPYTAGVPAIKYTMNQSDLKASMVDVMTAPAHTDLYWKSATDNNTNGEITFSFAHRLSSLGLKVKNSSESSIMINSVEFIVSGIGYSAIVIPLDGSSVQKTAASLSATLPLTLGEGGEILDTEEVKEIEISDKLIFIPQEAGLSVRVQIEYTRLPIIGYPAWEDSATITLPESGSLTTTLTEGTRHLVHLNFTDSEVEIKPGFTEHDWIDIPDVEDTFN